MKKLLRDPINSSLVKKEMKSGRLLQVSNTIVRAKRVLKLYIKIRQYFLSLGHLHEQYGRAGMRPDPLYVAMLPAP